VGGGPSRAPRELSQTERQLLGSWTVQLATKRAAHALVASRAGMASRAIGIGIVVLAAITTFLLIRCSGEAETCGWSTATACLNSVLSGLLLFLRLGELAARHATAASGCDTLFHQLQVEVAAANGEREDPVAFKRAVLDRISFVELALAPSVKPMPQTLGVISDILPGLFSKCATPAESPAGSAANAHNTWPGALPSPAYQRGQPPGVAPPLTPAASSQGGDNCPVRLWASSSEPPSYAHAGWL